VLSKDIETEIKEKMLMEADGTFNPNLDVAREKHSDCYRRFRNTNFSEVARAADFLEKSRLLNLLAKRTTLSYATCSRSAMSSTLPIGRFKHRRWRNFEGRLETSKKPFDRLFKTEKLAEALKDIKN